MTNFIENFDREFDEKFPELSVIDRPDLTQNQQGYDIKPYAKTFFHSQIEKILEDVMKCVPEKDKTENILEEHSFARFGYIIGFNSAIEQMIKNLELLLKNKEK